MATPVLRFTVTSARLGSQRWQGAATSKALLLAKIQELDTLADSSGLDDDGWVFRYHLEDQLVHIFQVEEEYWRQ